MLDYALMDNESQLVSQFFECLCGALGTTDVKTTSYHPKTN